MQEFIDFILELTDEELYEHFDGVGSKYYFLHGGCYEFAKIIKHFVNKSTIVIDENADHCGILYKGNMYDASGLVEEKEKFKIANINDIKYMEDRFGIPEKQNINGKRISKFIIDEIKNCDLKFLTEIDLNLNNDISNNEETVTFYHGGVEPDFDIQELNIYKEAEKQQKVGRNYAGFYMYGEENYEDAVRYAIQENSSKNTTTKGVLKIIMPKDLKIFNVPPFSIVRIKIEQIKELQKQGYDLVSGSMMGKTEYLLINKEKILDVEFQQIKEKTKKCIISGKSTQPQRKALSLALKEYNDKKDSQKSFEDDEGR